MSNNNNQSSFLSNGVKRGAARESCAGAKQSLSFICRPIGMLAETIDYEWKQKATKIIGIRHRPLKQLYITLSVVINKVEC